MVKFEAARELFPPPECESCVYRLQQPCLLFLVIPPFTGRRIGTYEHGIQNQDLHEEIVILSFSNQALNQGKASHDISKYLSRVILILTKFRILISTWFQVVPFGV